MTERRTIGQILLDVGRLTEDDVERALEHQRRHGGYFGEALLALDLVTENEVDWSLAAQFDLPYVFPDAEAVDLEAAALVTADWALANLALPILRSERVLTVVADSPTNPEIVEALRDRTGLEVELALASGEKVRQLIREVYQRLGEEDPPVVERPVPVGEWLDECFDGRAPRFGVSVRGHRAIGWYEVDGERRSHQLNREWSQALDELLAPPPSERVSGSTGRWSATLDPAGHAVPVEVRYLARQSADGGAASVEYLLRPAPRSSRPIERHTAPPAEVTSEVRLLADSGPVCFGVSVVPEELLDELLPHLPALLLESSRRAVHLYPTAGNSSDVFAIPVPDDPEGRRDTFRDLEAFRFDAATINLPLSDQDGLPSAHAVAPTIFVPCRSDEELERLARAGCRWSLQVRRDAGGRTDWSLLPVKG